MLCALSFQFLLMVIVMSKLVLLFNRSYEFLLYSIFFFKLKTSYDMRISDLSSDVCSSYLGALDHRQGQRDEYGERGDLDRHQHRIDARAFGGADHQKIGRASCRERGCQYV